MTLYILFTDGGSQRVCRQCKSRLQIGMSTAVFLIKLYFELVAQTVKRLSTMRETWVRSLGREDSLEKEMATHSSTLA